MKDTKIVNVMSAEDFAKRLSDNGLLSPDEIVETAGTVAGKSSTVNGLVLAERFVNAGKLTPFQAQAVLEQRVEELRIGNYDVLARLGAGAMGTVYKARHRRMKRIVAIKVLSRAVANPDFVRRFQREVEALAQLIHPNIVMAFDADEAEVGHFLVMEFVDGRDLATIVQQAGRMPLTCALDAIEQAARGLEYAHAKGIIHRDIKPANIMWDNSGVVKVADLGLARLAGARDVHEATALTQAGSILGTVDYMAPEQAVDSSAIDHRADIYSLGCALYFLLTAKAPYLGNSVMSVLLKHRDGPLPNLREDRLDAPLELEALIHCMMAKQPGARIASMSDVVQVLGRLKADLTAAEGASASAGPSIASLTVVVVELSRAQAGIVRRQLQELGIEKVHNANSGQQALALLKEHGAGALISSMQLADMTGMQLAQMIRADAAFADLGFVLTTSDLEAEDLAALRAMPHSVMLTKPFDAQKLATALAEATGRTLGYHP
jgi:serine/threonine-protein kinase